MKFFNILKTKFKKIKNRFLIEQKELYFVKILLKTPFIIFKNKFVNIFLRKRKIITATNDTIKEIVHQEIKKYGLNLHLNHIDTSLVTDFSLLFSNSDFNGDISQWNTSNAKYMSYMFFHSKFNGDISKWDVSNVKDMNHMFSYSEFNSNISNWDVSNVKDMYCMFNGSKFNNDISQWNVKNIKHYYNICCIFENTNFNSEMPKWNENMSVIYEGLNFPINLLSNKNNVLILKQMIKKANYPIFFNDLFSLSENFNLNFNKDKIAFINFLEINQEIKKIHKNRIIYYSNSNYPLRSLKIINVNLKDEYYDLLLLSNNFDFFYFFFKKIHSNLDQIFSLNLNYPLMFAKLEELINFFNKDIKDFPLVLKIINKFYDLEVEMLKSQNNKYIEFLNKNNMKFSYFYPYYSLEQKHNLIKCLNNTNKEIFNDEKMIFI